jgi:hypothetical protein
VCDIANEIQDKSLVASAHAFELSKNRDAGAVKCNAR